MLTVLTIEYNNSWQNHSMSQHTLMSKSIERFFFSLVENWIFVNVRKWQINSNQKLTSMSSAKLNIFSRYNQKKFWKKIRKGEKVLKNILKRIKSHKFSNGFFGAGWNLNRSLLHSFESLLWKIGTFNHNQSNPNVGKV